MMSSTSTYPRVVLQRFGRDALLSTLCAGCGVELGLFPVRAVLEDEEGHVVGSLCRMCLTAPADELSAHFEAAAEDFLSLASCFRVLADRARRRKLVKPTLGEWLLANQWAERDLLDSTGED